MLGRHGVLFSDIALQIVKLKRHAVFQQHPFPLAHPRGLLEPPFVKLPIQKVMLPLFA